VLVLILAGVLRWLAIVRQPLGVEIDGLGYWTMAANWVDGNGFVDHAGNRAFLNPGYGWFLAGLFQVFGMGLSVGAYANLVLGLWSVALCYRLGGLLGGKMVGLAAAFFWAVYVPAVAYTPFLAKENLQIPLILWSLCLGLEWVRNPLAWWRAGGLGAVTGMLALVAMTGTLFGVMGLVVRCALPGHGRSGLRQALLWGTGVLVFVLPWLWRNERVLGAPVLNTNSGLNLFLGNREGATLDYQGLEGTEFQAEWHRVRSAEGEVAVDRLARQKARTYIREHPGHTLRLWFERFWRFWMPPGWSSDGVEGAEAHARRIWWIQWVGLLCGALLAWRVPRTAALLWVCALVWALAHAPFFVMSRFQLPVVPLLCVLTALGLFAGSPRNGSGPARAAG